MTAFWKGKGYVFVFGLIIVSFIVNMAGPGDILSRLFSLLLQSVTLFAALRVSRVRNTLFTIALVLFTIIVILVALALGGHANQAATLLVIVGAFLIGLIILAIFLYVARDYRINVQSIFGSLCIYLLMGMFFAYLYAIVGVFVPPFFATTPNPTLKDYLYFSYITQTTVGYGDLVPAGDLPRALVVVQALIGQIYLVTVVALLVGNFGRPRRGSDTDRS